MAYMSNVLPVRNSKGKLIDYSKKKPIAKKNNVSNLEKKFEILNKKMKQVQMDYKNLQKELKKKAKK
ncbi:hypothetical protein ATCVNEJV2_513L [Acanthocystis turfacea Chlorella virus NE-JV-2]|nr:hypothetical protein ATCVNEJV2_513L [Acanthocystis turfacea Chlorella virus NE-JV-2]AGE56985.1 hypothetical protein ATCVNEJV3_480L [Acanthocystis turfacea Chlorella virus NE-JV-3]